MQNNINKKTISIIYVIIALLVVIITCVSAILITKTSITKDSTPCDTTDITEITLHEHNFQPTYAISAMCTSTGTRTYTCICGETRIDIQPILGHNYEQTSVTPSTNILGEQITYTCTRCNDTYTEFIES